MKAQWKKVISLILLTVITAAWGTVYAQEGDGSASKKTELYLNRLNVLGIMSETEDMNQTLTRGEMAKIVCGVGGYDTGFAGDKIFSDVPKDYVYAEYINTAYLHGIISGYSQGIFAPDEPVTREQMYKMLLCAAGYQFAADQRGGYPTGYLALAAENSLTRQGASGDVTLAEAAYTVFQALDMPVVEETSSGVYETRKDRSLLTRILDKNDMEISKGILTFDGYSSLNTTEEPDPLFAAVDGRKLRNDGTELTGLLGKSIEYFTKEGEMIAAYEYADKNTEVTFTAEDIERFSSDSYVVYTDSNSRKTYRLSKSLSVVYNKQGLPGYSQADLAPKNGNVTLIDNDNDGVYDVALVNERRYYVVDSASTSGLSVRYKLYEGQNDTGYSIDEADLGLRIFYTVTDETGKVLAPSAVCKNAVVGVSKSRDGKIINVVVTKQTMEGVLEAVGAEDIRLNGITYKLAKDAEGKIQKFDVNTGDSVTVYLNENGKVVLCESNGSAKGDYGYVKSVYKDENLDQWSVRVVMCGNMGSLENRKYWWVKDKLVQNDVIRNFVIGMKTKINGAKSTDESVNALKDQVIMLEISSQGDLRNIEVLQPEFEFTKGKYNHNTSAMVEKDLKVEGYDNPAVLLIGNIKTLVVPREPANNYTDDDYLSKYRIENGPETGQNVAFYDIPDGSQTPKLVVLKEALNQSGTAQPDAGTGILTSNIGMGISADGDTVYTATMINIDGGTTELMIRDDVSFTDGSVKRNINDLVIGDVIEVSWDSKQNVIEIHAIASAATPVDGMQMGKVQRLDANAIWSETDGDDFYNIFYYINGAGERIGAGVKTAYPMFRYENNAVEKIDPAEVVVDPDGIDADTVIIAGKIAVILPL